jgi:hypothetical protein
MSDNNVEKTVVHLWYILGDFEIVCYAISYSNLLEGTKQYCVHILDKSEYPNRLNKWIKTICPNADYVGKGSIGKAHDTDVYKIEEKEFENLFKYAENLETMEPYKLSSSTVNKYIFIKPEYQTDFDIKLNPKTDEVKSEKYISMKNVLSKTFGRKLK